MGNVLSPGYSYESATLQLPDQKGALRGTVIDGKVTRYLGVPYALPPTGEWRWKPPRPLPAEHVYRSSDAAGSATGDEATTMKPLDCTSFPPLSIQPRNYMSFKLGHEGRDPGVSTFSEDCLTLNIWVPTTNGGGASRSKDSGLPVVVWIHGGYLQIGDPASNPLEDPTELLAAVEAGGGGLQCVFVAVTYRLSAMGFLASRELQEEAVLSADGAWGNYGLWDQRLALEWVRENIASFGGDPGRVTLMGRSAGAYSVHAQATYDMLMPKPATTQPRDPLFSRLIMYSNAIPTNPKSVVDVQPQFDALLDLLDIPLSISGADKLARLRALPAETVNDAVERMTRLNTFRPVADGVFFPKNLFGEFFESGKFAHEFERRGLRLMIGDVQNEETMYRIFNTPSSLEALRTQLLNYYPGPVVDALIEDYHIGRVDMPTLGDDPDADVEELKRLYGRIASDAQIRAPTRLLLSQLEAASVPIDRVRRYRVGWMPSFSSQLIPGTMGVPHGGDTPAFNYSVMHGANGQDKRVMDGWIRNLTDFVHGRDSVDFGTRSYKDVKVLRADGEVAIEQDAKWDYLIEVAKRMAAAGKVEAAS